MSQMFLVAHVFWLFLILPLYKFLEPLNEVSEYIFDPAHDSSCDVPTELFFGVLAQLITKYIFPVMFPLVLLIFFGYRLYLSRSLHSSSLRLIMLIIHLCIIVAISFYLFILWVRSSKSLDNTVNLEPEIPIDASTDNANEANANQTNNSEITTNGSINVNNKGIDQPYQKQ
jgi:hypothetical protein